MWNMYYKCLQSPLMVYTTIAEYPDLITNNKHLLHSEVFF